MDSKKKKNTKKDTKKSPKKVTKKVESPVEDPNAKPKKPRNAYLIFAAEKRPELMEKNKGIKVGELSKLTGAMWKEMSDKDKEVFQKKAAEEKSEYEKKMEKYNKENEKSSDSDKEARKTRKNKKHKYLAPPKKPKNAYLLYADSVRDKVMEKNKGIKVGDLSKAIAQMWKDAPEDEKSKFKKQADDAKVAFKKEIEEYNKERQESDSDSD
ncbi:high mobility group protein dsp1 [Anaeramoeba ignava]|uniref:High mobility group protein dsp1 n=1 Tax=Anaeramoeba ignava TaxID=1746090 RepID=A0A9Q0LNC4_ANAIG|nr:high mobility group protein dsp1 [Anaeramoeba ignava]